MLPVRSLATICGGGDIQRNEHVAALYDYDATVDGMRRIVEALFYDPSYPADDDYVRRRYESSIAPGAWESLAAARFRRPGLDAAVDAEQRAGLRSHHRADAGRRGPGRQTPAAGLGRQIAGQITRRPIRGHRGRRPLSADRAARGGQRAAAGLLRGDCAMTELAGKVAIVTGGASGLGRRARCDGSPPKAPRSCSAMSTTDGGAALAADLGADAMFVDSRRVGHRAGRPAW